MRWHVGVLLLTALSLAGCGRMIETREQHVVHRGETAVIAREGRASAIVATSRDIVHRLDSAVEAGDQSAVERLIREGKTFELPCGTAVKVVSESFNERELRVLNGPLEGRTGWVPFEWLKPAEVKR